MRHVVFVLLAAVCFGTTGTAQALGPDGASALSVGAARILLGGAALALVAWLVRRRTAGFDLFSPRSLSVPRRERQRPHRNPSVAPGGFDTAATPVESLRGQPQARSRAIMPRHPRAVPTWLVIAVGALGVVAYQPAFFLGTGLNGVAIGTIVALGSAPIITGALEWLIARRFPGLVWLVATAVATAGVVLLSGVGGSAAVSIPGLLASLGAGASYAVYALASKRLLVRGWAPTASMGAIFGWAAVVSLPILLTTDLAWLVTAAGAGMTLWLGLVTTTLAYLLFARGLSGLTAATVSTLTLAEPLTASLLGVLLLGERLPGSAILGLMVLALGLVILILPRRVGSGGPTRLERMLRHLRR